MLYSRGGKKIAVSRDDMQALRTLHRCRPGIQHPVTSLTAPTPYGDDLRYRIDMKTQRRLFHSTESRLNNDLPPVLIDIFTSYTSHLPSRKNLSIWAEARTWTRPLCCTGKCSSCCLLPIPVALFSLTTLPASYRHDSRGQVDVTIQRLFH